MIPRVLLIIDSDPRSSPRPAEAIRIAAGLGAWGKVHLTVYLHGPAVAALGNDAEELQDGENYPRYLPVLAEHGHGLRVEAGAALPQELSEAGQKFTSLEGAELAALAATCACLLRF